MTDLRHEFVPFIPEKLEDHVIYVCLPFATVAHKCPCGCGHEVNLPLSPRDWRLIFDGETVSLYPSVGNWSLPCESHYWIENDQVVWAKRWSRQKIERNRKLDRESKSDQKRKSSFFKQLFLHKESEDE